MDAKFVRHNPTQKTCTVRSLIGRVVAFFHLMYYVYGIRRQCVKPSWQNLRWCLHWMKKLDRCSQCHQLPMYYPGHACCCQVSFPVSYNLHVTGSTEAAHDTRSCQSVRIYSSLAGGALSLLHRPPTPLLRCTTPPSQIKVIFLINETCNMTPLVTAF